jgi:hypothetical protein
MTFQLKDFLDALGPTASLIFAAWIFLSVLQQRYTAAYERYRALIQQYRGSEESERRRHNIEHQILLYARRCEQMRRATNIGVIAAMSIIVGLIVAGLNVVLGEVGVLKYAAVVFVLGGLVLVIVAAGYMVLENTLIRSALHAEPDDIPGLVGTIAHDTGGHPRLPQQPSPT